MGNRWRLALACVPCLLLLAGTAAVAPSASAKDGFPPIPPGPITFGISTSFTGANSAYGVPTEESFDGVTLKQFDATHPNGIDGHKLELKLVDDQSTVTGAVGAANELVAAHVAGIVTLTTNPEAVSDQVAVFTKNKVPIVSTLTGSQYENTKAYPYAFSPAASVQQEGVAAAKWLANEGFTKVAYMTDGLPQDVDALDQILGAMKIDDKKAKIVANVTIPPESVDDSAAITKLKSANPQVVIVYIGAGYGPVWQAMQAANWSPTILASAGAWYDGFSAMGSLATNAYAPYVDCATSPSETFSATQESLFAGYSAVTDAYETNYLTFIASDSVPVYILAYAIEKYDSTAPAAIKKAIEGIHNVKFLGINYNFSATNHYGITGTFGAAVCKMGPPYAGGVGKVPVRSNG